MGFGQRKGYIKKDYDADICVLDENFNVVQTYVRGKAYL